MDCPEEPAIILPIGCEIKIGYRELIQFKNFIRFQEGFFCCPDFKERGIQSGLHQRNTICVFRLLLAQFLALIQLFCILLVPFFDSVIASSGVYTGKLFDSC